MLLLGISGKARSGKNVLGDYLREKLSSLCGDEVHTIAFADELKNDLMDKFNLTYEQVHGDLKEVGDVRYPKFIGKNTVDFWTPREMMQEYGQFMRRFEDDYWVNKLFDKVDKLGYNNIIITDVRQLNEIHSILNNDGLSIRVTRNKNSDLSTISKEHITEIELDSYGLLVDYEVVNDGSIDSLYEKADEIIKDIWRQTKWLERKELV